MSEISALEAIRQASEASKEYTDKEVEKATQLYDCIATYPIEMEPETECLYKLLIKTDEWVDVCKFNLFVFSDNGYNQIDQHEFYLSSDGQDAYCYSVTGSQFCSHIFYRVIFDAIEQGNITLYVKITYNNFEKFKVAIKGVSFKAHSIEIEEISELPYDVEEIVVNTFLVENEVAFEAERRKVVRRGNNGQILARIIGDNENYQNDEVVPCQYIKDIMIPQAIEGNLSNIVNAVADNKVDKIVGNGDTVYDFVYGVRNSTGEQIKIPVGHFPYGGAWSGGIVKRYGNHVLVPSEPINLGVSSIDNNCAVSRLYVDRADTTNAAKIVENTKRIENLENTLLTYIEDDSISYEKEVPVGVGKNAVLSSIRGVTKKSRNLLNPSSFGYLVNEDGSFRFSADLGDGSDAEFRASFTVSVPDEGYQNNYYLVYKFKVVSGNPEGYSCNFGYNPYNSGGTHMGVYNDSDSTAYVSGLIGGSGEVVVDVYVAVYDNEGIEEFEPYFEGERYGKVTKIESYNGNIFNLKAMQGKGSDFVYVEKITIDYNNLTFELKGATCALQFKSFESFAQVFNITKAGVYSWGYNTSGKKTANAIVNLGGNTLFTLTDGFTVTAENIESLKTATKSNAIYVYIYGASGDVLSNIMLNEGAELGVYAPFTTEPIDTFNIPQEIQTINGYGKDGFVLDFENKTVKYRYSTTDISAYLTGYDEFKMIQVQGGGKVRFANEYELAVPSEINYVKAKG